MSTEKRVISIPRQLQIGDFIFRVVAMSLSKKDSDIRTNLECYDVDAIEVTGLKIDPSKPKNILINEKVSLPADGKLKYEDDIILNEKEAKEAVLTMYSKTIDQVEKELDALVKAKNLFVKKDSLNKKGATIVIHTDSSSDNEVED